VVGADVNADGRSPGWNEYESGRVLINAQGRGELCAAALPWVARWRRTDRNRLV